MPEAMGGNGMGESDSLTNLLVGLIGTPCVVAAKREGGRAADIAVLTPNMTTGWTQNVVILEAALTLQERA